MEPNSILLSCLLYLGSISSPNTYTTCTISQLESTHQQQISAIQNNPPLFEYVMQEYEDDTQAIDILQEECR